MPSKTSPSPITFATDAKTLPLPYSKQAVGAIRVSTDQQEDRHGPERQRRDIEREAAYAGLTLAHWLEESVSGAKGARQHSNAYYDLARDNPGMNFIFSASNRVARHVEIIVGIARELQKLGAVVWVSGIGNLSHPRNWKEFLRDAVDAESDYTNIVRQLTDGKRDKAQLGHWAQGRVPWGYKLARDERGISTLPVIDEAAARVVRRVFEVYTVHGGNLLTARQLNLEGLTTAEGKAWGVSAVASLIRNERYTGRAEFYGHVVEYPAIIDAEAWAAVQAVIKGRRKGERMTSSEHLLTGVARCGVCGGAMSYVLSSGGGRGQGKEGNYYRYLRCARVPECSHSKNYRMGEMEAACWTEFTRTLAEPDLLRPLLTDAPAAPSNHSRRLAEIAQEMADTLTRAVRYGLPDDVVSAALKPLQLEQERLSREDAPRPVPEDALTPEVREIAAEVAAGLPNLKPEGRRELLRALRVRMSVQPGGAVLVTALDLPRA
ncbi:recombinase family protein [Deinococcus sp. Arct2-2]|uniref:recombinase family protein n=1 Tax=Deinococcus sp. Arct2-2 TaxID=2568653 RepID=UPI0010A3B715|nr:recombinase family protein [Deinococcus sp. Arct2-2]THF70456.1 recombinase family protein [Deinococcus sp. Arct2-2]